MTVSGASSYVIAYDCMPLLAPEEPADPVEQAAARLRRLRRRALLAAGGGDRARPLGRCLLRLLNVGARRLGRGGGDGRRPDLSLPSGLSLRRRGRGPARRGPRRLARHPHALESLGVGWDRRSAARL